MTDMPEDANTICGQMIQRLLRRENLSEAETRQMFHLILRGQPSDFQQGAFLAALTAKGETAAEIAGGWWAVDELDTVHPPIARPERLVDTCGTGMDSCKTFNISTIASVVAAAGGARIARHGSRAVTSRCGTVDLAERLGVDMECPASLVASSIERAGIGLFNGMSAGIHPELLGRLLAKIRFGSPLNLAASLANPARPGRGLRGVHSPHLLLPVAEAMMKIGYGRALVVCGGVRGESHLFMDEASVCGETQAVFATESGLREFSFAPEDFSIPCFPPTAIAPRASLDEAARQAVAILSGQAGAPAEAVALNAALTLWLDEKAESIAEALARSRQLLASGVAVATARNWVAAQNCDSAKGLAMFDQLLDEAGR